MRRDRLLGLGAVPAVAIITLLLLSGRVTAVARLYADTLPANPWFVPQQAFLLYVLAPLGLLAALVVMLAPGVFLTLALGRTRSAAPLFLKGTLVAFVVNVGAFGLLKLVVPAPSAGLHAGLLCVMNLVAWGLLVARTGGGGPEQVGAALPNDGRRWIWAAFIAVATAVLLLPALFWQDLNPDGLEALTGGRSLEWFILPRFPDGETPGLNLGMITSSYPIHWFAVFFGLEDAVGRLPLLIYAPLIWMGLVALIEVRAPRRLTLGEEAALVAGLVVFIAALAFNDTYHAYSTDIASPANIDFLAMAGMLAMLFFFWNDEWGWFLCAAMFTHLTRPTGLLLVGMLGLSLIVMDREKLWPRLFLLGATVGFMLLWTVGFEKLVPRFTDLVIDSGAGAVAGRFRYLRFDHLQRLLWVVIPAGIVPVLALPLIRRHDAIARTLVAITALYFAHFYVLAFTALHHFAPAMLFPIVVFWRLALKTPATGRRVVVTMAAAALALWLSLPQSFDLDRTMRPIGDATVWNVGNYGGTYQEYREAFDHSPLLLNLFPPFWEVEDPGEEFIGSPWLQIRYSGHGAIGPETNYLAQSLVDPVPAGFTRIAEDSVAALYVKDFARWEADRFRSRNTEWQSPALRVRREVLFAMLGSRAGTYNLDLRQLLEQLRGGG